MKNDNDDDYMDNVCSTIINNNMIELLNETKMLNYIFWWNLNYNEWMNDDDGGNYV